MESIRESKEKGENARLGRYRERTARTTRLGEQCGVGKLTSEIKFKKEARGSEINSMILKRRGQTWGTTTVRNGQNLNGAYACTGEKFI